MGTVDGGDYCQCGRAQARGIRTELECHLVDSDFLLRLSGFRSCAVTAGPDYQMVSELDARLADSGLALSADAIAGRGCGRHERDAGSGCDRGVFRVLLGRLLHVAEIRARAGCCLLFFARIVTSMATVCGEFCRHAGVYRDLQPCLQNHLLSVNSRCDVIIDRGGSCAHRFIYAVAACISGAVFADARLSADVYQGGLRYQEGGECFATARRASRTARQSRQYLKGCLQVCPSILNLSIMSSGGGSRVTAAAVA